MWSTSKTDRCFRSIFLTINCAACIAVIYVYITNAGEEITINTKIATENVFQSEKLTNEECIPVCDSKACIWHANTLLRNIDSTVDPCDNFHSFSCGKFEQKFGPDEHSSIMAESESEIIKNLKDILENIQAESGNASSKMRTVYDSCINYGSSELQGIKDLTVFLNSLGIFNWPDPLTYSARYSDSFRFKSPAHQNIVLASFIVYADSAYMVLDNTDDNQEKSLRILFDPHTFKTSSEIPQELAISMLKYFDLESEDIDMIIKDHEFVKDSIINLYEGIEKFHKVVDININCSRQNDTDWHYICEIVDAILNLTDYKDQISAYSLIIEKFYSEFLDKLFPVLHTLPDRALANFLILNFINKYQEELGFYFRLTKLKHKHLFNLRDIKDLELDKWRYCVRWIVTNLRYPLVNEVTQQYFKRTTFEKVLDFYNESSSEIIKVIDLQNWLSPELKSELKETIKNIDFNMEEVSQLLPNPTHVNEVFIKFRPSSKSFFNNVLQLKRSVFSMDSAIKPLHRERFQYNMPTFEVNADSGLRFEFGYFFPPFYIQNYMRLLNFASLVPVFGHEIGHNTVSFLNANADKIHQNFFEQKHCLIEQFFKLKFQYLNENLNGSRYIDENLADSVAATLTNEIIEKYSYSEGIMLPGLPFSPSKLLYIIANQMWCMKSDVERDSFFKDIDAHAPNVYRLLSITQNSVDFSETFQCTNGSLMNPVKKCSLFDTNVQ